MFQSRRDAIIKFEVIEINIVNVRNSSPKINLMSEYVSSRKYCMLIFGELFMPLTFISITSNLIMAS